MPEISELKTLQSDEQLNNSSKQSLTEKKAHLDFIARLKEKSNSPPPTNEMRQRQCSSFIGEHTLKRENTRNMKETEPEISEVHHSREAAEISPESNPKITIINNDFSQINITQNINIEKYVKKKKHNRRKNNSQDSD